MKEKKVAQLVEKLVREVLASIPIEADIKTKRLYKMLFTISSKISNEQLCLSLGYRLNKICQANDFEIGLLLTSFNLANRSNIRMTYQLFNMTRNAESYIELHQLFMVVRRISQTRTAKQTFLRSILN